MRVFLFHKGVRMIGVMVAQGGLTLTPEQKKKLVDKGIGVLEWMPELASHDGHVNRCVDTLIENEALGFDIANPPKK